MAELIHRVQTVVMETERLRFATWSNDDWRELKRLTNDPLVVQYLGSGEPWPDERVQQFVAQQCTNWEKSRFCLWKLLPKDSDELIGICGLQPLPEVPDVEIAWWLTPSHWGQGLGKEAARRALAYGFEETHLDRIVAIAQAANRVSIRVMERSGMWFESEAVHKGKRVVIYAMTRDQYNVQKSHGEERG